MTKESIIKIVKALEPTTENEKKVFGSMKDESSNKAIGCNQFRTIASLCRSASCYDEIELLVKYNESKCERGNSWASSYRDKTLGGKIVDAMQEISNNSGEECLEDLSLFFGYLYWSARIWSAENATPPGQRGCGNGGHGGNFNRNNYRRG